MGQDFADNLGYSRVSVTGCERQGWRGGGSFAGKKKAGGLATARFLPGNDIYR